MVHPAAAEMWASAAGEQTVEGHLHLGAAVSGESAMVAGFVAFGLRWAGRLAVAVEGASRAAAMAAECLGPWGTVGALPVCPTVA